MLKLLLLGILTSFLIFVGVLLSIAFLTLLERKLISSVQNRKGPNTVGFLGILQPFADALKLLAKEAIFPRNARLVIFLISPLISLFFALIIWAFIPFSYTAIIADINIGIFFIFTMSILHIYGIILAGWSSNSRYSFLGAIRSTAQLVAYDISIGLIISTLALFTGSFNLMSFVEFQDQHHSFIFYLPFLFFLFLASSLAETNRHPFDLPEAESELVGGFNTEYSSSYFAFFFLGEYCSVLVMVFLINHLFLGGWVTFDCGETLSQFFYLLKLLAVYYFFIFIRAAIPRYRYDQLMRIGWKIILPACLSMFFLCACIVSFHLYDHATNFFHFIDGKIFNSRFFPYEPWKLWGWTWLQGYPFPDPNKTKWPHILSNWWFGATNQELASHNLPPHQPLPLQHGIFANVTNPTEFGTVPPESEPESIPPVNPEPMQDLRSKQENPSSNFEEESSSEEYIPNPEDLEPLEGDDVIYWDDKRLEKNKAFQIMVANYWEMERIRRTKTSIFLLKHANALVCNRKFEDLIPLENEY